MADTLNTSLNEELKNLYEIARRAKDGGTGDPGPHCGQNICLCL